MWATIVESRTVNVCAVTFTGPTRISQWPGSRVISAQKANTAAAFNLPAGAGGTVDALDSSNALETHPAEGGSLWGLQFSNPVDAEAAYGLKPRMLPSTGRAGSAGRTSPRRRRRLRRRPAFPTPRRAKQKVGAVRRQQLAGHLMRRPQHRAWRLRLTR